MASAICSQRSYADFILQAKKILPKYFGFDGVGILFKDSKTNSLFTLEQTFDEDELAYMKKIDLKKEKNIDLTKEERQRDFER